MTCPAPAEAFAGPGPICLTPSVPAPLLPKTGSRATVVRIRSQFKGKVCRMMRVLRASTICLAIVAATIAAPAASAWSNNNFFNPSGNIQCTYEHGGGAPAWLACQTRSNHHVAWLEVNTPATSFVDRSGHFGLKAKPDGGWYGMGHVLPYGQHWQSHQFECLSTFGGVRCWTSSLSHGFFINAWELKTF